MSLVTHFYKKSIFLILATFFVWSIFAIASDQHDVEFSLLCPICQAKICINGTQSSFVLDVYPVTSYQYIDVKPLVFSVPIFLPFEGRASPGLPQG